MYIIILYKYKIQIWGSLEPPNRAIFDTEISSTLANPWLCNYRSYSWVQSSFVCNVFAPLNSIQNMLYGIFTFLPACEPLGKTTRTTELLLPFHLHTAMERKSYAVVHNSLKIKCYCAKPRLFFCISGFSAHSHLHIWNEKAEKNHHKKAITEPVWKLVKHLNEWMNRLCLPANKLFFIFCAGLNGKLIARCNEHTFHIRP